MKEITLKAVSMPPKVYWAPMMPVVTNFAVQMAIMMMVMGAFPGRVNPSVFIFTFLIVHFILVIYGIKQPHLSNILRSKGPAFEALEANKCLKPSVLASVSNLTSTVSVIRLEQNGALLSEEQDTLLWHEWLEILAHYNLTARLVLSAGPYHKYIILSAPNDKSATELSSATDAMLDLLAPLGASISSLSAEMDILRSSSVEFQNKDGIIRLNHGSQHMAFVDMQRLGDYWDSQMISDILALNKNITVINRIRPIPTIRASALLNQQQRMSFFTTFSQAIFDQYTIALKAIREGQILTEYALSFLISASSAQDLQHSIEQVETVLKRYNFDAVHEKSASTMAALFLSQFPTYDAWPRTFLSLSGGVAEICRTNALPNGKNTKWGGEW